MVRRFRRIPKVSSSEKTRSLEYLKKQTSEDIQVLAEAREAFDLADSKQEVALTRIQKLCEEHSNTGLLFLTQADILEKCFLKATSLTIKKRYLEDAKRWVKKAYELSPKNMLVSSYLGYLMSEGTVTAEGYMHAMDQLNEAYLISNPTDPLVSDILYDGEVERFMELFPTYQKRIENARKNIVEYLAFCVLKLKELHINHSFIEELGLKNEDKVKLYFLSLSFEERQRFVRVKNLTAYLISSKKYLANRVLAQALRFYEGYGKWEYWMCCSCNMTFPNSLMHLRHVTTTHFKELSQLRTLFPLSVDRSDWFPVITSISWKPVDTSTVIPMLERKWNLLPSARKKNHSTPRSSSNADVPETPIEGSTFELLSYDVNSWAKREIFKWKWPFVKDDKRKDLLLDIRKMLDVLLSENKFLPAHMNILIQQSIRKLDGPLGVLLRDLRLEQTHYPLCLLNATQLQEIHNLLQEMSDFTKKIFEQQSSMEKTLDWSKQAFKINGAISLSSESLYLKFDESSFVNEPTSGNSSVKNKDAPVPVKHLLSTESTSGKSPMKDDDISARNKHLSSKKSVSGNPSVQDDTPEFIIPPSVEGMVTWIYSDHSSDESLKIWKKLRDERRRLGKEKLVTYKDILRKVADCQEGLSVNVIPNDVSDQEVGKDMDFALQIPQVDSSIEATTEKESVNNDSKLTEINKLTLQFAMHMHQLEILLNHCAAYDYQPIVLSIVKTYFQEYAESIVDTTRKSDGAAADQIEPDCGTEEEDAIKMRNMKALLESQTDQIVPDCGTEDATQALVESQDDQILPYCDTEEEKEIKLQYVKALLTSIGIPTPDSDSEDNTPEPKVP